MELMKDFTEAIKSDYKPTPWDQRLLQLSSERFSSCQASRSRIDTNRGLYQDMIDAPFEPYGDERSSSAVPLARALIEHFVIESQKIPTEFIHRAETQEYATEARVREYVRKYDRRTKNRKLALLDNDYTTSWFGTGIMYSWYESYKVTQKDAYYRPDGTFGFKSSSFDVSDVILDDIDIRKFRPDDHAIRYFDTANDCFYQERESYDRFKRLRGSNIYKNIDLVQPINYSNEYETFITAEDVWRQGKYVKKTYYRNIERDLFMVIANGVIIRAHPIISTINGRKALPFVFRVLWKKTRSLYGVGFCEALMMFNKELNDLREMIMDGIRRSNSEVLALGNGLSFNGREFTYDNEFLTFDGRLDWNFQQITWTPPNQHIFNYIDRLYKDVAVYCWIDVQNIVWTPNRTAFEVEVQREASQKRLNVYFLNRDLAYERLANLHMENLQKFFPKKDAEGLYPMLESEDEEYSATKQKGKQWKFIKKKGKYPFRVTPEMLRGNAYIDVHTNVNLPTINAVERQQKLEVLRDMKAVVEAYAISKQMGADLNDFLPMKDTIKDIAESHNMPVKQWASNEEVQAAKSELRKWLEWMMTKNQPNPAAWAQWETPLPPQKEQWAMMPA